MNREIKFRGISSDKKWHFGCLVNNMWTFSELTERSGQSVCEILTGNYTSDNWQEAIEEETNLVSVIPESVGQFTGLKDKNGKEIYEGDILSEKWKVEVYCSITGAYMVKFHNNPKGNKPEKLHTYLQKRTTAGCPEDCEIIGNIYQNPELL